MRKYEVRPATLEDVTWVGENACLEDRQECEELHGSADKLPSKLRQCWIASAGQRFAVFLDGQRLAVFGLASSALLGGKSTPWMISACDRKPHARFVLQCGKNAVAMWKNEFELLENYVSIKQKATIRWLKRLGFKFQPAKPYGANRALFHRFYMEN